MNFGALRSFVFAFFSFAKLKSVIEFNNCDRSPDAGGGAAAAAGGGGGGGGAAETLGGAAAGGGGAAAVGLSGISTLIWDTIGFLDDDDDCAVVNCNGSTLIER